jgi:hypothetical protein
MFPPAPVIWSNLPLSLISRKGLVPCARARDTNLFDPATHSAAPAPRSMPQRSLRRPFERIVFTREASGPRLPSGVGMPLLLN